jgi:hypothetical protein
MAILRAAGMNSLPVFASMKNRWHAGRWALWQGFLFLRDFGEGR